MRTTSTLLSRFGFEPSRFPSPRPSPLPKGRGGIVGSPSANRASLGLSGDALCCSLSPAEGERVRVRGRSANLNPQHFEHEVKS